jgi:hypothetical protein
MTMTEDQFKRLLPRFRPHLPENKTSPLLRRERARGAAGDPQRLRNIPVIGGSPGAIPNTRPDTMRLRDKP